MKIEKDEFYAFLSSITGVAVKDETLFFDKIGMDGMDAWSLIEQIAQKYNVDFTGYNWEDYHHGDTEIGNVLKALKHILKRKRQLSQFSALHLFTVVIAGKWFAPASN